MVSKVAVFQDITLGFDGSASLRYAKGLVDDDGNSLGGIEPHRLTILPDCEDVAAMVRWQNSVLLGTMSFEVKNGDDLADFIASAVEHHRENPTIAANAKAWCDAAEAKRLARIAEEEELARQRSAAQAAQDQAAEEVSAARKAETQSLIDAAVAAALAGQKV
ncbi:MAG: hypothetical protein J0I79_20895 [Mesorhizobium sp.]|uniref:hypothetical protein n=1 Tax=Mesorhizobium sp. TaxID=1871066 RepID=UPI001ACCA5C4|nr:hypothetical protein [Mesorhizobium sp.]MBN9220413.1 hypothetical protein [Mesorhizobium sp.]